MDSEKFIKLFTNCKIVKGNNRSLICDLQRLKYFVVPNSLVDIFGEKNIVDIESLKKNLDEKNLQILFQYLDLLEENELIFYCKKTESLLFPELSLEWDFPAKISNIIIDINKDSEHDYLQIFQYLISINCRYIQFRFFDFFDFNKLQKISEIIKNEFVLAVDFILKDIPEVSFHERISKFARMNKKIRSIVLHSSKDDGIIQSENEGFGAVLSLKENIASQNHCGLIQHNYFITNIETFTESQHHNTCLNRKISIDKDGNIKNCPSMKQNFGNIKNTTLQEALNHPDFKKYWNITKDQIEVCKDCEFRHICTDCRAYIEEPDNQYSKPLKCGYNPYTNIWEEWSTNPLKQKAIEFYGMQDLIKKNA